MKNSLFILLCVVFLLGCDKGISPNDSLVDRKPGFAGSVAFVSSWPSNVLEMRIVAVPYYPVDSTVSELIGKFLNGVIKSSDPLSVIGDSGSVQQYTFFLDPGNYEYVAIVQRYGQNYYTDWRVISIYGYTAEHPTPKQVTVQPFQFITGIDFTVDFNNLPPQPFKP